MGKKKLKYLEEIIFKEISHGLVARDSPPAVQIEVQKCEPNNQDQCRQLGLVTNSNKQHEYWAHNILKNLDNKEM